MVAEKNVLTGKGASDEGVREEVETFDKTKQPKRSSTRKTPKKTPRKKAARKKPRSLSVQKKPEAAKKTVAWRPKLTILMPGDVGYEDNGELENVTLLDPEFVEQGEGAQPEPELTQSEIVASLRALENPKTAKTRQVALLTKLGRVLDAGGDWIRVRPLGRKACQVSVREYLIASLLQIRDKHGKLRGLFLTRAQKDYQTHCGKRSIILKARQLGMTTYVAARFFINCITRPGTLAVQVAHDQRSAEEIFRIVHRMLENLPQRFRKGALKTSRANARQIVFPTLDSEYRVETAADPNAGRGLTIQNLHCSEVARWPRDIAETLASLRAAVPPDGEIVLESTPNGASGAFYHEWQHAEESGYTRHFYPWWYDKNYRRKVAVPELSEEELELQQQHHLDDEQIAFRREIQSNFGRRAREEFAEDPKSCFLASGECAFDVDVIEQRLEMPQHIHSATNNSRLLTFLPPQKGEKGDALKDYIIGVDPAGGGVDGDFACAQVIERETGLQCAELLGHFTPDLLACEVAALARQYNHALVAVERNNHGHQVISELMRLHRYDHMYPMGKEAGWLTTSANRPRMVAALASNFRSHPQKFHSHRLLEQMRTFVYHANRSVSAARGCFDDAVMAMGLALVVRDETAAMPFEGYRSRVSA